MYIATLCQQGCLLGESRDDGESSVYVDASLATLCCQ